MREGCNNGFAASQKSPGSSEGPGAESAQRSWSLRSSEGFVVLVVEGEIIFLLVLEIEVILVVEVVVLEVIIIIEIVVVVEIEVIIVVVEIVFEVVIVFFERDGHVDDFVIGEEVKPGHDLAKAG